MSPRHSHFGPHLRDKRLAAHKTLGDVARALSCSVSFVSDVEHGRRHPFDRAQIEKVAELLRVEPNELQLAAAKDRKAVKFESDCEDHLEMAASFTRVLDSGDAKRINFLRAMMARLDDPEADEDLDVG